MCGIVGIINLDGAPVSVSRLEEATRIQRHRGPDDEGYLLADTKLVRVVQCGGADTDPLLQLTPIQTRQDEQFDLGFGFRRLSIQDLSPAGHQPMASADGRLWIVFNGEIYNYLELRTELAGLGHEFNSGSDTEVILAAYRQWGRDCLDRFNGMFALAIWDTVAKELFIARDRFGEKPLHYVYEPGRVFAFSSEIKGLWSLGVADREVHEETLSLFKLYGNLDGVEQTFYRNIRRLPQAHFLVIKADGKFQKKRYWDVDLRDQDDGRSDSWYEEAFRELFIDSVKLRLRADVPVGSSLSGGLDSSTVVCVMNKLLPKGAVQKTFSARFDDPARDEGKWIELVTSATSVEPFQVWPSGEQMFQEMSDVFWHHDEPFGSASIYAQWCVMRLAKENRVTVLLDGQGADEMLAGYHSYFGVVAEQFLRNLSLRSYLDWRKQYRNLHGKEIEMLGLGRIIKETIPASVKKPVKVLLGRNQVVPQVVNPEIPAEFEKSSALRKTLWWHTTREGLNSLLRYADRDSMAHSREVRLPFLDHRLVEFVFRLPDNLLLRNGWTKWILRKSFQDIVPHDIAFRVDKLGFQPPQEQWLGGVNWQELMLKFIGANKND